MVVYVDSDFCSTSGANRATKERERNSERLSEPLCGKMTIFARLPQCFFAAPRPGTDAALRRSISL